MIKYQWVICGLLFSTGVVQGQVESTEPAVTEVQTTTTETKTAETQIQAVNLSEPICKKGDLKDCARVLKVKNDAPEFRALFDQVCFENKTFKCVKITIRSEPKEELAYQKTQYPKSYLFLTKDGTEDKIYRLDRKEESGKAKK